jgi:hypothetical protein
MVYDHNAKQIDGEIDLDETKFRADGETDVFGIEAIAKQPGISVNLSSLIACRSVRAASHVVHQILS